MMNKLKNIVLSIILLVSCRFLPAQERKRFEMPESIVKETVLYAVKDNDSLYMDIYKLKDQRRETQPVMLFQFGGSFQTGWRDRDFYGAYLQAVTEMGFTVVSIDYRLGMQGRKYKMRTFTSKAGGLARAVRMAVEDLFTATSYLIDRADDLRIYPDSILASGSSAGAISVLQADWVIKNAQAETEILPEGFTYKGIIGFAGGIFSHTGAPKYEYGKPAPTLMFHGSKDKMVPYRTIRFFNTGMFTSKYLERRMRKEGVDYIFVDMKGKDHYFGAETIMTEGIIFVKWFLEEFIRSDNGRQIKIKTGKHF